MNNSRLNSAKEEQEAAANVWWRSPLVLIAGLVLFIAALALIVLSVTGGDDTADDVDRVDIADSVDADAVAVPQAEAETDAGISFGGLGSTETAAVGIDGDVLPAIPADGDDPAIGTLAPVVTANSLANGNPITLDGGSARVIGFFAHWCPHCQAELPELTDWLGENELPPNTEFIAISTAVDETRGNFPPSAWFTDVGWPAPVLVDDADSTLLNTYGFSGFPAFIAIDASGVVVARAGGNIGTEGFAELFEAFAS